MLTSSIPSKATPQGRHQRKLKNYLLDRGLQLRYTGYILLVAVVIGGGMGIGLWQAISALVLQAESAVEKGETAVALGRTVLEENQKVSAVVRMNIQKDPTYADDPELLAAFQADASVQDATLLRQQKNLEAQADKLKTQAREVREQRDTLLVVLPAVSLLLVLIIAAMGIYVTHKVAGPIYKMKRQLAEVGRGSLRVPQPLRKGDELVSFFATFDDMVRSLRKRQEVEIQKLDRALEALSQRIPDDELADLRRLREEMVQALEV